METSLHHVADLPAVARSEVEKLVGHPLQNDEVLWIGTFGVENVPDEAERRAAWDELQKIIAESQRNAAMSGLTAEQIDVLVDAECATVRYR